ncbi:MAG TPA: hypothetical protein VMV86_03120 [Methanosarcinales archaeon]|nr:hypothetical protein [Methanosarcinales archaeon]
MLELIKEKPAPKCKRQTTVAVPIVGGGYAGYHFYNEPTKVGCNGKDGKCGCTHAEQNMLKHYAYLDRVEDIAVWLAPCAKCAYLMVEHIPNLKIVYYGKAHSSAMGINILKSNGVELCRFYAQSI